MFLLQNLRHTQMSLLENFEDLEDEDLEDHLSGGGSDKVGEHPPECVAT